MARPHGLAIFICDILPHMPRNRIVVGFIASALLLLNAMVHSIVGAPAMLQELRALKVRQDLEQSLLAAWQLGGVLMLLAGLVCGHAFLRAWRGDTQQVFTPRVIGVGYVLFGLWAMLGAAMEPFYLVFVVPGLLLVFAARG